MLWMASFFILLFFFAESDRPQKIDLIYTSVFLITIIVPVVINLNLLIPWLLTKELYVLFLVFFLLNLIVFTEINKWIFNTFIDVVFPDYYFVSYHSNTALFFIFSFFLLATTLLKLSADWFHLNKAKNVVLQIEKVEVENQLSSLKSQINPHFLFNSLNVLYALSLENKEETSSAILDLSSILRYVLYETGNRKITLKKEVELIQKYLDFQKYRTQSDTSVRLEISVEDFSKEIHPMLLLPLIENSFKHGVKGGLNNTFVHMTLFQDNDSFTFRIENNISEGASVEDRKYSGLGLKNIQQNLTLIYPDQHSFNIDEGKDTFTVTIKIDLNDH
jgi:sensor histidine kinase YesM